LAVCRRRSLENFATAIRERAGIAITAAGEECPYRGEIHDVIVFERGMAARCPSWRCRVGRSRAARIRLKRIVKYVRSYNG
jgi:hypothetical protein